MDQDERAYSTNLKQTAARVLSFRILTVNAHKGFTFFNRKFILHELRDAVRSISAEVVFLQEVLGAHAGFSLRYPNWPATPQYEFLADTIWSEFAYGCNAIYPDGHHGNALLSKFPIVRYQNRDVSVEDLEKRGLLHCILQVPGSHTEIHTVCVHLGLREAHRRQQLNLLCHLIDKDVPTDAPLIVAGDFNDWRLRAHAVLDHCASLREVFVETHGKAAKTFPARWPILRLDRIYVRNVSDCKPEVLTVHPWTHLSDHAPLIADIKL